MVALGSVVFENGLPKGAEGGVVQDAVGEVLHFSPGEGAVGGAVDESSSGGVGEGRKKGLTVHSGRRW